MCIRDSENFLEKDREGYEKFFENFGRGMKYGLYTSYGTAKDVLGDLLLFYSAKPVSYTHLDVYKRTVMMRPSKCSSFPSSKET